MISAQWIILFAALLSLGAYQLWRSYVFHKKYKFPPKIPGVPFLGSIFNMPPVHQGPWAKEQAEKYGEMFTVKLASNTWVFLNSSRVVYDLMEKRSAIYSSRPPFPFAEDVMSGGCRMLLMPYGDRWRSVRKIVHTILNKTNGPKFAPFQDIESKQLLHEYLETPEKWFIANQRYANSVIMSVVFGKRMDLGDRNIEELFDTSQEFIAALQPGANLVDTFYWLDKLPKALKWWIPKGQRAFKKTINVYRREVVELKQKMQKGTAKDCFAVHFLNDPKTHELGEDQILFALGSLMEAGSDTSRMTISQILAAAATDPSWVRKAQQELDSVCGRNAERLPDSTDRERLPYISAVTKEGFRWRPFAEIGVPHMLTQDDEYEGYRFPAGTLFTWNSWNISMSPTEYDEPERFWPERFLNKDLLDPLKGHWAFGPGRRVCAGYNVGDTNVWIAIARILYCFKIEEIPGQPIDTFNAPWGEHRFAPFPVKLSARSPQHAALIKREGQSVLHIKY